MLQHTQSMRYTQIYNGREGASHLESGEISFTTDVFAPPAPPLDVSPLMPAQSLQVIRLRTGWTDAAHPAPARQWMFVLAEHGEVTASGETWSWGPGDLLLAKETDPPGHATVVHDETMIAVVHF